MLVNKLQDFGLSRFIDLYSRDLNEQTVNSWHLAVKLKATPSQVNYFMLPRDNQTRNQRVYQFISSQSNCKSFLKALMGTNNEHVVKFIEKKLNDNDNPDVHQIKLDILNLTKGLAKAKHKISELQRNPIPIGFVYVQLPDEPSARELWPNPIGWKDVTSSYAGLFFRAEGGQSAPFGQTQPEQTREINQVTCAPGGTSSTVSMPKDGWTDPIRFGHKFNCTGSNSTYGLTEGIKFRVKGGEIRPINTAVRIWKRTN